MDQALVAAPVARAGTRTITSTGSTRRDDVSQQTAPKVSLYEKLTDPALSKTNQK